MVLLFPRLVEICVYFYFKERNYLRRQKYMEEYFHAEYFLDIL